MDVPGAATEVATLKKALSEAVAKVAKERAKREKQEARVREVQQELQEFVKKYESLERDSRMQGSKLVKALETAKNAKAEAQKALQEIEAVRKIVAGKAFIMQSKHVKELSFYLPEFGALQERSQIYPAVCRMPRSSTGPRRGARRRGCSGLSILGPNIQCP